MFFSSQPIARPLHVANLCWAFANVARADEFGAPAVAMRCARPIMFSNLPQKVIIRKSLVKKPWTRHLGNEVCPYIKPPCLARGFLHEGAIPVLDTLYIYMTRRSFYPNLWLCLSMVRKYNPLKPPKGGISSGFDGEYFSA